MKNNRKMCRKEKINEKRYKRDDREGERRGELKHSDKDANGREGKKGD